MISDFVPMFEGNDFLEIEPTKLSNLKAIDIELSIKPQNSDGEIYLIKNDFTSSQAFLIIFFFKNILAYQPIKIIIICIYQLYECKFFKIFLYAFEYENKF